MRRTPVPPREAGLAEIDAWCGWFRQAQLDTIAANGDMRDAERTAAIAEAHRLTDAIGERMRDDLRLRTAPR
jgi:hypothetical protein